MKLIDTHAHLYLNQFSEDIDEVIHRCHAAGVSKVLLPNIDTSTIADMHDLVDTAPDFFAPMMGLHPCSVKEDYLTELEKIHKELDPNRHIAVGEIGLDYYWDKTYRNQQIAAFEEQIGWAKQLQLPIVVHCRESFEDIITILEANSEKTLTGVLHCFTGTAKDAGRLRDIGFYVGIGGVLTFKNGGLDKVLPDIDPDQIILETDGAVSESYTT